MTTPPLVNFRATYRTPSGGVDYIDLLARSLSAATLNASELMPTGCTLLRVVRVGEW